MINLLLKSLESQWTERFRGSIISGGGALNSNFSVYLHYSWIIPYEKKINFNIVVIAFFF